MVRFKNTDSGTVIVHEPAYGVHREFLGKNAIQTIPFEIVEQLLWRPGFKNMIESGMLYIEDMQDKIDLGLEEPDTKVPTKIKILTEPQMLTIMKVKGYDDFVKELETVSNEQINSLIDYSVENSLASDIQKVNYLKEITGRDIVKLIAAKRENEEIDRIQASKNNKAEGEFSRIG